AAGSRGDSRFERSDVEPSALSRDYPIIEDICFEGLRRISAQAVKAQIRSRVNEPFDPEQLDRDVRRLARLGWFASVRVEAAENYGGCGDERGVGEKHGPSH